MSDRAGNCTASIATATLGQALTGADGLRVEQDTLTAPWMVY